MRDEVHTSRAMNIDADVQEITSMCAKHNLEISAIETLLSGGTRVVLNNGDDAARLRRTMKAKLIDGTVRRAAWVSHRGSPG